MQLAAVGTGAGRGGNAAAVWPRRVAEPAEVISTSPLYLVTVVTLRIRWRRSRRCRPTWRRNCRCAAIAAACRLAPPRLLTAPPCRQGMFGEEENGFEASTWDGSQWVDAE